MTGFPLDPGKITLSVAFGFCITIGWTGLAGARTEDLFDIVTLGAMLVLLTFENSCIPGVFAI